MPTLHSQVTYTFDDWIIALEPGELDPPPEFFRDRLQPPTLMARMRGALCEAMRWIGSMSGFVDYRD